MLVTLYCSQAAFFLHELPKSQCQTASLWNWPNLHEGLQTLCCVSFDLFIDTGLVICPSRELAKQTHDIITHYCTGLPQEIRCCLAIGGIPVSESMEVISRSVMILLPVTCSWGSVLTCGQCYVRTCLSLQFLYLVSPEQSELCLCRDRASKH